MALLEALVNGVPAIVSPEVERCVPVAADGAGRVAMPTELGRVLEELALLDAGSKATLSKAARGLAAHYEWPLVARRYEGAYESAVSD
jgi:glycosyltransferase involved in cell wall biosynthesis